MKNDTSGSIPSTIYRFWKISRGFWTETNKKHAFFLTIIPLIASCLTICIQYWINRWNASFFDAIANKNTSFLTKAIGSFAILATASALCSVFYLLARMHLQLEWRKWLTTRFLKKWIDHRHFYPLINSKTIDAPEFRIAEDVRISTEPLIDFLCGLLTATITIIVFAQVLWQVGGSLQWNEIFIPGYMVVAACLYATLSSCLMIKFGRPLIGCVERRNALEAQFRSEIVRVRENAESIALLRGEKRESLALIQTFQHLSNAWKPLIRRYGIMTCITGGNNVIIPILPLFLLLPNYLNGSIGLGGMMQTAAAFVYVQNSLNWFVDNFGRMAEWTGSLKRILGLWDALEKINDIEHKIRIDESQDKNIHLNDVKILKEDGTPLFEAHACIGLGEKVLLTGASGTGKSTLNKAIAGIWPWGEGTILLPKKQKIVFLPQRSYIPMGSLREILLYPNENATEEKIRHALQQCGLVHLVDQLDKQETWSHVLSGGEVQRLAFARVLLASPNIIVMDEATSALDPKGQDSIMKIFETDLAHATLISIGHRPELEAYHQRKLLLQKHKNTISMFDENIASCSPTKSTKQ